MQAWASDWADFLAKWGPILGFCYYDVNEELVAIQTNSEQTNHYVQPYNAKGIIMSADS